MDTIWRKPLPFMTVDDFLAWPGDGSGRTFQLVDGEVRPVSPASVAHGIIQANVVHLLKQQRRHGGRKPHIVTEAAIVPALNASMNVRVPDLAVTAAPNERGQQELPNPILLIEILSPGNQDDTRDNVRAYATLPSVEEMVVLHSTRIRAEVHRREPDGTWAANPEVVGPGERLRLSSVGLDAAVEDAYEETYLVP